jgi:hypothetical protein
MPQDQERYLPIEGKAKYGVDRANAAHNGWRQAGRAKINVVIGNVEIFNIPKFTKAFKIKYPQPDVVKAHLPKIEVFAKALHSKVVLPSTLRSFAIVAASG